jgi:DNA-directed RNA polymerase subunit RPC12/RpoP
MGREVETTYGCFRCGSLRLPVRSDDPAACSECGERGIVTFRQAMDILNEMHLRSRKQLDEVLEVIDISEYDFEERTDEEGTGE